MSAGISHLPAELQRFARSLAADDEPGIAIGCYADGVLSAYAVAGCAVAEHGVPVTERTLFDIASVSKHMTATCLLLLARDGVLGLDDDIRPWLPELAVPEPLTLRQCLSHTSGLRDYFTLCEIAGIGVPGMTEDRFTDLITGQRDLDFAPGAEFSYSNTGYTLASVLVRRATGKGLAQVAAERVFGPLGMTVTRFRDDVSRLVPDLAAGYVAASAPASDRGPVPARFRRYDTTEEVIGDGAVVTSLADLAAWHGFLATGAGLGPDIRDGLLATRPLTGGAETGYGLGVQAITAAGRPAWWHSGSWAGYRAAIIFFPELHAGVTVLTNRNDRYASHVAVAAAAALLDGADPLLCYGELGGAGPAGDAVGTGAASLAGLWHEPDQDVFLEVAADGEDLLIGDRAADGPGDGAGKGGAAEESGRFVLGSDGRWHGTGTAAASCFEVRDGELIAVWGLADRAEGRFRRADPAASVTGGERAVPAGSYWNAELLVRADLRADPGPGGQSARIAIGLAPERPLVPAGPGVWRCRGGGAPGGSPLTVRESGDGAELLVSAPGARRVRFGRVSDGAPDAPLPRGLRGWAR